MMFSPSVSVLHKPLFAKHYKTEHRVLDCGNDVVQLNRATDAFRSTKLAVKLMQQFEYSNSEQTLSEAKRDVISSS